MPDIPQAYDLANDSEFRLYALWGLPPRPGQIKTLEVSGAYTVEVDDQDGGTVTAWPLNGFVYAIDDIVYIAYAANATDSAIILGAKAPVPIATAKLPYGGMYQDEVPTTITVSAANTWYDVDGMTTDTLNGFTFQNGDELLAAYAGKYKVDWSISFTTSAANQDIEGAVFVNSTEQHQTEAHRKIGTATDEGNFGGTGIITLAVDDVVKLRVQNETSTANIIVGHANLSLVRVG